MGPKQYATANGRALREQREALDKTLRQVAAEAGCTHSFIAQVERGVKTTLSPQMAVRLLTALDVPPHEWKAYFTFHGFTDASFRRPVAA